jgi:hypothetical protein
MVKDEIKSRWIAMRNAKNINPQLLYDYAIHCAGSKLTAQEFSAGLQFQDINAMIDTVDHELELNILYDKNGQFIKVIQ